ncbi:MAG TPA: NUDIX hydrolase [Candidatus Limnocylindria bacterium]|nr:NUDIX hydrolase [Candidatus Limnocylindria bacterium]
MAKKRSRAKVLSSKVLFRGRVFGVRRDDVIEPGGIRAVRELVTHPGSVVVLPVFPDGRILVIRQFRYVTGRYLWELVAGHKEPDESFAAGARRELQEEAGYSARRLNKMLEIFPSPGLLTERMVIYVARELTQGKPRPEDDEKITARRITLREAELWIRRGKIRDAKSVSGILYYSKFVAAPDR